MVFKPGNKPWNLGGGGGRKPGFKKPDWKLRWKFAIQRGKAKDRNIEWELTYEQWIKIWTDSGHLHERGCRRGQYVMARKGDKGPYSADNVMIITNRQNSQESIHPPPPVHFGNKHATKLNRQIVAAIRRDYVPGSHVHGCAGLGRKYKVRDSTIRHITSRKKLEMKGIITFNRRMVKDNGPDFYPTPRWGTLALLEHVGFAGPILEPCCGDGAISKVLEEYWYEVVSSDKYDRGYGTIRDFFDINERCSNLVTNPPFNLAEPLLAHALKIVDRKICLLLRLAFLESKRRYEKFYRDRPPSKILVFSERLSMYPAGTAGAGGTTAYGWFIWNQQPTTQTGTHVEWIRPGLKTAPKRS